MYGAEDRFLRLACQAWHMTFKVKDFGLYVIPSAESKWKPKSVVLKQIPKEGQSKSVEWLNSIAVTLDVKIQL